MSQPVDVTLHVLLKSWAKMQWVGIKQAFYSEALVLFELSYLYKGLAVRKKA